MPQRAGTTPKRRDFTTAGTALGAVLGGLLGMLVGDPAAVVGAAAGAGTGFMVGAVLDSAAVGPRRRGHHGPPTRPA